MLRLFLLLLFVLTTGCSESSGQVDYGPPYKTPQEPAEAQELRTSSNDVSVRLGPRIDYNLADFHFVNERLGYAVGDGLEVGHYPVVYKTLDGGQSWSQDQLRIGWHARGIRFIDEQRGIISTNDVTGCPTNCLHKNIILKTFDGGASWEKVEVSGTKGTFSKIETDDDGNYYAALYLLEISYGTSNTSNTYSLVKSSDAGNSWETIYGPFDDFHGINGFIVEAGAIYVPADNGTIIKLDQQGNELVTMRTGYEQFYNVLVTPDGAIFARAFRGDESDIIRTIDDGVSWTTLYGTSAHITSALSANDFALVVHKTSVGPADTASGIYSVVVTTDGGHSWIESEWVHSLLSLKTNQVIGADTTAQLVRERLLIVDYSGDRLP